MIFSGAGLVFLGGLMGSTICVSFILKKNKVPWLTFANIIGPLIFLGYAIGRLGCFLLATTMEYHLLFHGQSHFQMVSPPTTTNTFRFVSMD